MAELLAMSAFVAGYLAITLEHRLFVNKAAASLLLAVILWLIVGLSLPDDVIQHHLMEIGSDIFGLIVFLLTAMTLVEILVHYHLFDVIERWLRVRGFGAYGMGWALIAITFLFSAVLDNLTTTIVVIQIARRLFSREDLLKVGALTVIAANAGGAFSPIGDVTTLMLWFAGKFSAGEIIWQGFLPSLVMVALASALILPKLKGSVCRDDEMCSEADLSRSDKTVLVVTLLAFLLPLPAAALGLPPYMGLLAGLGFVWALIDVAKRARPQDTHLQASIQRFLQKTDIESLQFFVGILLAVGALSTLGVLGQATDWLLGVEPSFTRLVAAFVGLGVGSAIVDNVPLTAAAISGLGDVGSVLWVLLALMVGMGGSILLVGSAAGVVTMGMVPGLTIGKYWKIATWPALLGFIGALAMWLIQYQIFW